MAITFPANPANGETHTHNGQIYVYNSTRGYWLLKKSADISVQQADRSTFVATASQTTHSVTYDAGSPVVVSVNGIMLNPSDFTAENGTSITFETALTLNDEVDIIFYTPVASTTSSSGSPVTEYANFAAFPTTGNTVGDFGFDLSTGAIYNWSGSTWKRIYSGADESPTWTTSPPTTANLATDGTATTQTVLAVDPEGFPIEYSYDTNPVNQTQATITNTGGNFTITPSTDIANNGSFSLRYKATDGIHVSTKTTAYSLNISPPQSWTAVFGPVQGLTVTNTRNALALSGGQQNFNSHTTHSFRYWMINPIEMKGGGAQGDFQMASVQFQLNGSNVSWPAGAQVLNVYNGLVGSPDYGQPMINTMDAYNNPQSLVDNDGTNAGGKHYFGGIQSTWSGSYFNFNIVIDAGQQITANEFNYWTGNDVTDRDSTGFWVYGSNISGDFQ